MSLLYDVLTGDVSCRREAKLEAAPRELTPNPDEVAPPVTVDDWLTPLKATLDPRPPRVPMAVADGPSTGAAAPAPPACTTVLGVRVAVELLVLLLLLGVVVVLLLLLLLLLFTAALLLVPELLLLLVLFAVFCWDNINVTKCDIYLMQASTHV